MINNNVTSRSKSYTSNSHISRSKVHSSATNFDKRNSMVSLNSSNNSPIKSPIKSRRVPTKVPRPSMKRKEEHIKCPEWASYRSTIDNVAYFLKQCNANNKEFMIPFETCSNPLAIQIFKHIVYHPNNGDNIDAELCPPKKKDDHRDLIKRLPKESFLDFYIGSCNQLEYFSQLPKFKDVKLAEYETKDKIKKEEVLKNLKKRLFVNLVQTKTEERQRFIADKMKQDKYMRYSVNDLHTSHSYSHSRTRFDSMDRSHNSKFDSFSHEPRKQRTLTKRESVEHFLRSSECLNASQNLLRKSLGPFVTASYEFPFGEYEKDHYNYNSKSQSKERHATLENDLYDKHQRQSIFADFAFD